MDREMGGAVTAFPSGAYRTALILVCFQDFVSWGQSCRKVSKIFESCYIYAVFGRWEGSLVFLLIVDQNEVFQ